jgi:hypothetical protein
LGAPGILARAIQTAAPEALGPDGQVQAILKEVDRRARWDELGRQDRAKLLEAALPAQSGVPDSRDLAKHRPAVADSRSAASEHQAPAILMVANHQERSDVPGNLDRARYLPAAEVEWATLLVDSRLAE